MLSPNLSSIPPAFPRQPGERDPGWDRGPGGGARVTRPLLFRKETKPAPPLANRGARSVPFLIAVFMLSKFRGKLQISLGYDIVI